MPVRKHGRRWQVRVAVGNGQRLERTLPIGATRADALAVEAEIRRRQIDVAAGRGIRYSIDEAFERWLPEAQRLKSWTKDLQYKVDILREYTAGQPLEKLADVAGRFVKVGLANDYSAAHINRHLAILRRIGRLASDWEWLPKPPVIALLPGEKSRHTYLTTAQLRQLMKACDPLLADIVLFAVLTGLRRGEILRLQPDHIRDGVILLDSQTKSGKPRAVPMPPEAAAIARKRVPFDIGGPLLHKRFNLARIEAGMPLVRFHDLRHTYASWIVQKGGEMASVRDLLGHSSIAVTNRYSHLSPHHLRAAVAKLPRVRQGSRSAKKPAKRAA